MATKLLFRIAALAAALLAAAACVYPYEVDIDYNGDLPLVVEGDIHIGSLTTVRLSYVQPFKTTDEDYYRIPFATGYIEGEDGTRIEQDDPGAVIPGFPDSPGYLTNDGWQTYSSSYLSGFPSNTLTFHTENLSLGQRYRLHLETYNLESGSVANVFESEWLTPLPAPTIDGLSYSHHPEYEELWVGLSMHCHGSHYFRWTFSETWEYHSDIPTSYEYKPYLKKVGRYEGPTLYYCWDSANSSSINIFSTANQTEDRFEELAFHTIPLNNRRLQVMYRIKVQLEAMSENAYNYWYNIQQNSEGQGSIFAPTPSEMASNIHCITDPDIQVMGYLNAAVQTDATMYYDNRIEGYYKPGFPFERFDEKVSVKQLDSMAYWYAHGFLPYQEIYESTMGIEPTHYMWAQGICIDCRKLGGTKVKPEGWPTPDR